MNADPHHRATGADEEDWDEEQEQDVTRWYAQPTGPASHARLQMQSQRSSSWVVRLRAYLAQYWQPRSLHRPQVDPHLPDMSALERSAEVIRYSVLNTEYWLSAQGYLREWVRFNLRVATFMVVPTILIVPMVTYALGQFQTWAALLAATTSNLILFPLSLLLLIGLISGLVYVGKTLLVIRRLSDRHRAPRSHDPYYD